MLCAIASQAFECEVVAIVGVCCSALILLLLAVLVREIWRARGREETNPLVKLANDDDRTDLAKYDGRMDDWWNIIALGAGFLVAVTIALMHTGASGRRVFAGLALLGAAILVIWLLRGVHSALWANAPRSGAPTPSQRMESARLKLQFLQGVGLLATAVTILLTFGGGELARFGSAKPLFYLQAPPTSATPGNGRKTIDFVMGNEGGWVMFLGVSRTAAQNDNDKEKTSLPCGPEVLFTKTPPRYQILRQERGAASQAAAGGQQGPADPPSSTTSAAFRVSLPDKSRCHLWLEWVDANGSVYRQKATFRPAREPIVHIGAPGFRRAHASALVAFSEVLGLVEPEDLSVSRRQDKPHLSNGKPDAACYDDEYRYCVSHEAKRKDCPPTDAYFPCSLRDAAPDENRADAGVALDAKAEPQPRASR